MDLPREIRNRIFAPLLIAHKSHDKDCGDDIDQKSDNTAATRPGTGILIADHTTKSGETVFSQGFSGYYSRQFTYVPDEYWMAQPAITQVSREIRSETLPVYYGANPFQTYVFEASAVMNPECQDFVWLNLAEKWLRAIGPENRSLIKNFEIRMAGGVADWKGEYAEKLWPHALWERSWNRGCRLRQM